MYSYIYGRQYKWTSIYKGGRGSKSELAGSSRFFRCARRRSARRPSTAFGNQGTLEAFRFFFLCGSQSVGHLSADKVLVPAGTSGTCLKGPVNSRPSIRWTFLIFKKNQVRSLNLNELPQTSDFGHTGASGLGSIVSATCRSAPDGGFWAASAAR
jgi:hypothetical protein